MPTQEASREQKDNRSARMQSMRGVVPTRAAQHVERVKSSARMRSMRGVVPTRAAPTQRYIVKRLPPPSARSPKGEHGFGGGRRRAAPEGCEHRRVPTPHLVVLRGGSCGEGGIRTLGTVARTLDFQSSTFDHSVTSPGLGAKRAESGSRRGVCQRQTRRRLAQPFPALAWWLRGASGLGRPTRLGLWLRSSADRRGWRWL